MVEKQASTLVITLPAQRGGEVSLSGDHRELVEAADKLNRRGIITVPDNADGNYRLLISGLKNASQLNELIGRPVTVKQSQTDDKKTGSDKGISQWISHHKLRVAGILYLIGDSTLFLSGVTGGKPKEAMSGLLWAGGGVTSTVYGDPATSRQIKNVGNAMSDFMASQGVNLGTDTALYNLTQSKAPAWLKRINGFLYKHPSEAHNAFYLVGSGTYFQSGLDKLKSKDPKRRAGWWQDMGVGATVGTGAAIGTFVGEKKHEEGKDKAKITDPVEWVKEKPLRVSGIMYMLNNAFSFLSAFEERRQWKEHAAQNPESASQDSQRFAHVFKFITTGVFVISNVFMSLSSRHNSELETEQNSFKDDMIGGLAAEVIAAQPDDRRPSLITTTSIFLSKRYEISQSQGDWEKILTDKVDALRASQWMKENADSGKPIEALTDEKTKQNTKTTVWTEKVSQPAEQQVTSQSL